jgi:hypothetical protein
MTTVSYSHSGPNMLDGMATTLLLCVAAGALYFFLQKRAQKEEEQNRERVVEERESQPEEREKAADEREAEEREIKVEEEERETAVEDREIVDETRDAVVEEEREAVVEEEREAVIGHTPTDTAVDNKREEEVREVVEEEHETAVSAMSDDSTNAGSAEHFRVESRTRGPGGAGKTLSLSASRPFFALCQEDPGVRSLVEPLELSRAQSEAVMEPIMDGSWCESCVWELGSEASRALEWATIQRAGQQIAEQARGDEDPVSLRRPYDNDWLIERVPAGDFGEIDLRDSSGLDYPNPTDSDAEDMAAALGRMAAQFAAPEDMDEPRFPLFFTFVAEKDCLGSLETGGIVLETPTTGCFFMTQYYYD